MAVASQAFEPGRQPRILARVRREQDPVSVRAAMIDPPVQASRGRACGADPISRISKLRSRSRHDDRLGLAQGCERLVVDVEVRLDELRRGQRQPLAQRDVDEHVAAE